MVMRNKTCLGITRRTDVILKSWILKSSESRRGKWFTYIVNSLRSKTWAHCRRALLGKTMTYKSPYTLETLSGDRPN